MDPEHPGLCFGFGINKYSSSNYSAKLYFNDHDAEQDSQSIPTQLKNSYENITSQDDTTSFQLYSENGYGLIQNLVSNAILRDATNNTNATITLTTVPFMNPAYTEDDFA